MKRKLFIIVFCFFALIIQINTTNADVFWQQNWDNIEKWQSIPNNRVLSLSESREQAWKWNCSGFRYPPVDYIMMEVTDEYSRSGSQSFKYQLTEYGSQNGGGLYLIFDDPNISWIGEHSYSGYDKIYYQVWMRVPKGDLTWNDGSWKAARFYVYDNSSLNSIKNTDNYSTVPSYKNILNSGMAGSSHYFFDSSSDNDYRAGNYKYSFFFPMFASKYLYWYASYHEYDGNHDGTSTYPVQGDNNESTYLTKVLNDGLWHCFEFEFELNQIQEFDSKAKLWIDGNHVSSVGSNHRIRGSINEKVMTVVLFDNYYKKIGTGNQTIYLDDMTLSTTYIGIKDVSVPPGSPKLYLK